MSRYTQTEISMKTKLNLAHGVVYNTVLTNIRRAVLQILVTSRPAHHYITTHNSEISSRNLAMNLSQIKDAGIGGASGGTPPTFIVNSKVLARRVVKGRPGYLSCVFILCRGAFLELF